MLCAQPRKVRRWDPHLAWTLHAPGPGPSLCFLERVGAVPPTHAARSGKAAADPPAHTRTSPHGVNRGGTHQLYFSLFLELYKSYSQLTAKSEEQKKKTKSTYISISRER